MQDTSIYLDQLEADRQSLIANLKAKGVAVEETETFTTLVQKVLEIAGGTSESKTATNTISDIEEDDTKRHV